jgi:hypothetical protein
MGTLQWGGQALQGVTQLTCRLKGGVGWVWGAAWWQLLITPCSIYTGNRCTQTPHKTAARQCKEHIIMCVVTDAM